LWFLWAAPPLAAQRAVPSGQDAEFLDAYRQSDPITKWPLKQIKSRIPELNGLKPATDQSQLPGILRGVSENLQNFTTNFVNIAALETVDETEGLLGPQEALDIWGAIRSREGALGMWWNRGRFADPLDHIEQEYRYLMLARREGSAFTLVEYRTDLQGREEHRQIQTRNFIKTTGFAAMPLFFGPLQQPWSDFRYLGRQKIGGSPTEAVAFAEHVDPVAVMGRFSIGEASIPILVQGVAWFRTSDYQILKMRTDLLGPLGGLKGVTTVVLFARNQFQGIPTVFWLPQEVRVYVALGNVLLSNRHKYSEYRLFRAESVIKTDFPAGQQH
jgi:hypothetical protein